MKTITLRASNEIYEEIQKKALKQNMTVSAFILSNISDNYANGRKITLDDVYEKISELSPGDTFTVPGLFEADTWNGTPTGIRLSLGRSFKKAFLGNSTDLKNTVKYLGKNSANLAIYQKI